MNKPNGKTFALYRSIKTGQDCRMDITDVYNTMIDEVGKDVMSAGIVTSIISLATNNDGQAFYYGSAEDCMDYLMADVNDRIVNPNRYKQPEPISMAGVRIKPTAGVEPVKSSSEKKRWLVDRGWSEINTGGNYMVMFKDFICSDGKTRMVGIDGEVGTEDGCLYPVSKEVYWSSDDSQDKYGEECVSTVDTELLEQYQRDEIYVAQSVYTEVTCGSYPVDEG